MYAPATLYQSSDRITAGCGWSSRFLRGSERRLTPLGQERKVPKKTREKTREKTRGETREEIMRLLGDRPEITSSELAAELGITGKGVEWQLSRLRTSGRIRRVGPDKGGHWEVVS